MVESSPMSMMYRQALLLVAVGCALGIANNLLAGETRRLAWFTDYPAHQSRAEQETRANPAPPEGSTPGSALAATSTPASAIDELATVALPEPDPERPAVEIEALQARRLHGEGAIFIDARRTRQFEEGHIAGALSVPIWETAMVDERLDEIAARAAPEEPIVIYCNGGDCEDSHMVAERLWIAGFVHVMVYSDGYPDWIEQGGALATGASG